MIEGVTPALDDDDGEQRLEHRIQRAAENDGHGAQMPRLPQSVGVETTTKGGKGKGVSLQCVPKVVAPLLKAMLEGGLASTVAHGMRLERALGASSASGLS